MGLSALDTHRAFVTLVLALATVGMYWLLIAVWGRGLHRQVRVTLALLYGINPYVSLNLAGTTALLLPYSVVPLVALFTARGIELRSPTRLVAGAAVWAVVAPGINPAGNMIALVGVAGATCAVLLRNGAARIGFKWPLMAIALVVAASVWWLGPFLASLRAGGAEPYLLTDPIELGASRSSFIEVFRLTGLWALYQGWDGSPYYASQSWLLNPSVIAATLGVPVAALVGMWRAWSRWPSRVAAGLLAVAIPLAVSVYPPKDPSSTGDAYRWLHDNIFAFQAFRSNYKWVGLIALALVLLGGASQICLETRSARQLGLLTLTGLMVGVLAFTAPFASRTVLGKEFRIGSIPGYWNAAGSWLDDQPGSGRVLLTPNQAFAVYSWGRPLGNVAPLVTKRPVVEDHIALATSAEGREVVGLTTRAISDPSIDYVKVLRLLGVRWVLQRNDVDWAYYGSPDPARMRAFLGDQPDLTLVSSFGELDVYEVGQSSLGQIQEADQLIDIAADGGYASAITAYTDGTLARFRLGSKRSYIRSATASSDFFGLTDYLAERAVDGDQATSWVVGKNRGVGEVLSIDLTEARQLKRIDVYARVNGVDTTPSRLLIQAGSERREVELDEAGRGSTDFGETRASEVRVQIEEVRTGGTDNVGLAEVAIEGAPAQELVLPKVGELNNTAPRAVLDYENDPLAVRLVDVGRVGFNSVELVAELDPKTPDDTLARHIGLDGVAAVRATSRYGSRATSSPYLAFDGNPKSEWIADSPGRGEQVEIDFSGQRDIPHVTLTSRTSPPPVPITIEVMVDGESAGVHQVTGGAGARTEVPVRRRGARLQLRVLEVGSHDQNFRVGFSEIEVPGLVRHEVPLNSPSIAIDGREVGWMPTGDDPAAAAFAGGSARFTADVAIQPGAHVITSAPQPGWRLKRVLLRGGAADDAALLRPLLSSSSGDTVVAAAELRKTSRFVLLAESHDPLWKFSGSDGAVSIGPVNGYAAAWSFRSSSSTPTFVFDQLVSTRTWRMVGSSVFGILALAAVLFARHERRKAERRALHPPLERKQAPRARRIPSALARIRESRRARSHAFDAFTVEGMASGGWLLAAPAALVAISLVLVLLGLDRLAEGLAKWAYYMLLLGCLLAALRWAHNTWHRGRDR